MGRAKGQVEREEARRLLRGTESVFYDEQGLLLEDPRAPGEEERFVLLGLSSTLRMLVVVQALRSEDVIRIISARRATRRENQAYQSRRR